MRSAWAEGTGGSPATPFGLRRLRRQVDRAVRRTGPRALAAGRRRPAWRRSQRFLRLGRSPMRRSPSEHEPEDASRGRASCRALRNAASRRLASATAAPGPRGRLPDGAATARRTRCRLGAPRLDRGEGAAAHDHCRDDEDLRPPAGEVERLPEDVVVACRRRAGRRRGSPGSPRRRSIASWRERRPPAPTMSFGRSLRWPSARSAMPLSMWTPSALAPAGDPRVVVDEGRDAARLRDRARAPRRARCRRRSAFGGDDQRRDVAAGERVVERAAKASGVNVVRCHQAQATAASRPLRAWLIRGVPPGRPPASLRGIAGEIAPALPRRYAARSYTVNSPRHLRAV